MKFLSLFICRNTLMLLLPMAVRLTCSVQWHVSNRHRRCRGPILSHSSRCYSQNQVSSCTLRAKNGCSVTERLCHMLVLLPSRSRAAFPRTASACDRVLGVCLCRRLGPAQTPLCLRGFVLGTPPWQPHTATAHRARVKARATARSSCLIPRFPKRVGRYLGLDLLWF